LIQQIFNIHNQKEENEFIKCWKSFEIFIQQLIPFSPKTHFKWATVEFLRSFIVVDSPIESESLDFDFNDFESIWK
jgi:hypothetical protein